MERTYRKTELFLVVGTYNIRDGLLVSRILSVCERVHGCAVLYGDPRSSRIAKDIELRYSVPVSYVPCHHAKYVITDRGIYVGSANLTDYGLALNVEVGFVDLGFTCCSNIQSLNAGLVGLISYVLRQLDEVREQRSLYYSGLIDKLSREIIDHLDNAIRLLNDLKTYLEDVGRRYSDDPPTNINDVADRVFDICADLTQSVGHVIALFLNVPAVRHLPEEVEKLVEELSKIEEICNEVGLALSDEKYRVRTVSTIEEYMQKLDMYRRNEQYIKELMNKVAEQVDLDIAEETLHKLKNTIKLMKTLF